MTNPQVAGAIETLNQGVRAVPSLRQGIGFTLVLAMLGASGRVAVSYTHLTLPTIYSV